MEIPSSQQANERNEHTSEKKRINDGVSVILDQMKAVEGYKLVPLRKFRLETVCIDTLTNTPLYTKMWVTEDEFVKGDEKEKESYKCEICEKSFDKRQKMLLHQRFHKK